MKIDKNFIDKVKFLKKNKMDAGAIARTLQSSIGKVYHALAQIARDEFKSEAKNVLYHTKEWELMRQLVLTRDGNKCVRCGKGNSFKNPLQIDHILAKSKHPDLAFNISNLRTLCLKCHKKAKTSRNLLTNKFSNIK